MTMRSISIMSGGVLPVTKNWAEDVLGILSSPITGGKEK
jgi:hypothetical protein